MTGEPKHAADQELDLDQFGAKKKLKKGFLAAFIAFDLIVTLIAGWMLLAGFSFKGEMAKYDTATIIALKDANDPSKQCRCIEMKEGLGYLTVRIGMSIVFDGPRQECGHDAMITFANASEQYTLTLSTRCGYIKYPPTAEFPSGESRNYSEMLVGSYLDAVRDNGVDCDCIN